MNIADHIKAHEILGVKSSVAAKPRTIAYIGDSITAQGNGFVKFAGSAAPATWLYILGSRSWTMTISPSASAVFEFRASDASVRYTAPNDTAGAWTPITRGLMKLESGSTGLECLVGVRVDLLPVSDATYNVTFSNTSTISNSCVGYWNHAQMLSGQLLECVSVQGISSDSLAHINARVSDIFEYNSYLEPISKRPGYVVVQGGTNDVFLYSRTAEDIKSDINSIVSTIKNNGATPILLTITARNSATTQLFAIMQEVNRHILNIGRTDANVIVVDTFKGTRDPAVLTGAAIANYLIDNAHPSILGAYRIGKCVADTLVARIGGGVKGSSEHAHGGDTANFYTNVACIGTAGAAGTGVSGTVPTNMTVNRSGSSISTAVSVEQVANELPWVVLTSSGATAGDSANLLLSSRVACSSSVAAGQRVIGEVEFSASSFSALRRIDLFIDCYNSTTLTSQYIYASKLYGSTESSYSIPDTTISGIIRTPIDVKIPDGTTSLGMWCMAVYGASGSGTVKFRNMTLKAG